MMRPTRRALLSVSDKTGLVELARALAGTHGVELIATGGTRAALSAAGLAVRDIADVTRFPEILGGRVKTLHPAIYAGLLAKRDDPAHLATLAEHGLAEIDLVVCNLYPFEATVQKPGVTEAEWVEQIDIGGPTMLRAAAKNFAGVTVLTRPEQYEAYLAELAAHGGATSLGFRRSCAAEVFARTAGYDAAIAAQFLAGGTAEPFPAKLSLGFELAQPLRYGENPHQAGAFYREPGPAVPSAATAKQLHGKELSYNNLLDLDAAFRLVAEFSGPTAVVVKHNTPCGAATAGTLADAFNRAWDGDPQSAFGGILAFNRPVDASTADALATGQRFVECVIAPGFDAEAFEILTTKPTWRKNVRLLETGPLSHPAPRLVGREYRRIAGGLLVQDFDDRPDDPATWTTVTTRPATADELAALAFGWGVCKHVKSNAIVLARSLPSGAEVVGVGAGQMSRVDSVQIAVRKAGDRAKGSVLASDAFFPFADNVEAAAAAGVTAIVQPGGSQRDADSVAACDKLGLAMLFTGRRHFRH